MADITLNPDQLKATIKSAIVELLQDNKAEFSELLAEVIEDIAMERAIGKTSNQRLSQLKQISGWMIKRRLFNKFFQPLWLFHQECFANC